MPTVSQIPCLFLLRVTKMNEMQSLFTFECKVAIELLWKNGERLMHSFKNSWLL